MPAPVADPGFLPEWDETKLAKSSFPKLLTAYHEAKAAEAAAAQAAAEYRDRLSALFIMHKVDACRADGYTVRWRSGGSRRTLVPQLLLQNGCPPSILEKSYKVTDLPEVFVVIAPRTGKTEDGAE